MQHTLFKPISKSFRVLMLFMFCLKYDAAFSQFFPDKYYVDTSFVSDYEFKVYYDLEVFCLGETDADVHLTTSSSGGDVLVSFPVLYFFNHNNYNPTSYTYAAGPGYSENLYAWATHYGDFCDGLGDPGAETVLNCTTEAIFDPADVSATDEEFDTKIVITWSKGTMIPDSLHSYFIYKNGVWLATVPGTSRSYEDTGLPPGQTYTYKVSTWADFWGGYTSPGVEDEGSTLNINLNATDGDFYKKTKLTWNDLSDHATDIRVERSLPAGGIEEIAILNKNATTYTDLDGIAGFNYTYYVTPIDSTNSFLADADQGYSKPNGKISGHVTSPEGAGVDSVYIFVEIDTVLTNGGAVLPAGCTATYCAMTDVSGYYEIEDVYYYLGADFIITPQKDTHHFTPVNLVRSLNENTSIQSFVDFTDLNVITVGGRVTYPEGPGSVGACGVEGVSILIGDRDLGIRTDAHGDWSTSLNSEGTYSFSAKLHDHVYKDPQGNTTTTLYIGSDNTNINFENKTNRIIHIIAQAGCNAPLGTSVEIQVTSPENCFSAIYSTDPSGELTINQLPPRDYSVAVIQVNGAGSNETNIEEQLSIPIEIDLSKPDTMMIITDADSLLISQGYTVYPPGDSIHVPGDTILVQYKDTMITTEKSLCFIYRAPIIVEVDFEDAGADVYDCSGEEVVVIDQDHEYLLKFNVMEALGNCSIDTGTLIIYDEISDKEDFGQKIPIKNGIARYLVQPGNPDIAESTMNNHQKYLYVVPKVDFADPTYFTFWALVTGIKSGAEDVTTRTPEIPQLIIHDPPGDNSFATIEKGTTYTTTSSTEIQVGGDVGGFVNFKAGPQFKVFSFQTKAGALMEFEAKAGRDTLDNDVTINTITFLENYSTSPSETFVGNPGDVFIGSAMNQKFTISQELTFDPASCETSLDSVVEMGFTSFATTFIYTEHHIMNSLLPTLELLKGQQDTLTNDGKMEYNDLDRDIRLWNQILTKNALARDANTVLENISISSGADLTKSYGSVNGTQSSYTYNSFFETKLKLGAFGEVDAPGIYLETEGGFMGTFKSSTTEVKDTLDETTRTVTYTISDNDIGDYFSIDVLRDTVYDVPAFRNVAGRSSCPHEPNTAARERPSIGIYPPIVNNVPPDEVADFILNITNNSEVGETRQYAVKVVSKSNPDGAIVNVAGSDINTFPIQYYFDANQTISLAMTVSKGPLATNYDSIGIEIYSECEYAIWGNGGNQTKSDTVWFSVNFLSECTNVSMHLPNQGWLVNQASNNTLHTVFTGYDIHNEFFEGITLQMKRDGYGYTPQTFIPKASLTGPNYDYFLNVLNFPDGEYTLRARADCGIGKGYTYSSEVSGTIDRTSLAPFGIPTPSDGFLREGQEVSVTFDKIIDCDFNNYPTEMVLIREDTDAEIPFTTSCFGNKVIINTTPPLIDQLDLEGVLVTARVHKLQDENGNVQEYPTQWSFLVNVSPVFWDPEDLYASGYESQHNTIKATLKNTSLLSKAFSLEVSDAPLLIDYPDWITPVQRRGTILSSNDFTIDFDVEDDLAPGIYTGIVTAMVDSLPVSMTITYEHYAEPVNWHFDPTDFEYSMTAVLQFSLDGSDANLSTDPRDLIGAFVNGQTRGITHIEYLPEIDKYRAFLTIYSKDQGGNNGEKIKFKFWRALTGVEYGAIEFLTFTYDKINGSMSSPVILHPEGFFQIIPLNKGWNWISFNVATSTMTREKIFENLLNSGKGNVVTVKSSSATATYTTGPHWNGPLSTLKLGEGYMVHLSNAPDTLKVVGLPSAVPISVAVVGTPAGNWNWIGFPRLNPEEVDDVLLSLTPATGNVLKSKDKFAAYDANLDSWLGNLHFFNPGGGYKLFLNTSGTIVFQSSRSDGYEFNPYLYEYNMNITGFADLSVIGEHDEEELIIGAFIDGECRGTGVLEFVEGAGAFRTFMLVNGNVADFGKKIEFRIKNDNTGAEYSTNGLQLTFIADGLIGKVMDPYLFFSSITNVVDGNYDGYELNQNQPNPTNGKTSISFAMPRTEKVLLRLYDLNGELIKIIVEAVMAQGDHIIETDLTSLPVGIYYYEMRTENFIAVKKLVRQ